MSYSVLRRQENVLEGLTRRICSCWEIPDNLPASNRTTAVVAMALSPLSNGELGEPAKKVLKAAAEWMKKKGSYRLLISNRFPAGKDGLTLADEGRSYALRHGVGFSQITIPNRVSNSWVRNTRREAEFAITWVDETESIEEKSILIIANSIHMKRVVLTFQKALGEYKHIKLYWKSVGEDSDYGKGFVQKRFAHPLFFLCYEVLVLAGSKITKIA